MSAIRPFRTTLNIDLPDWIPPLLEGQKDHESDEARMHLVVALARENVLRGTGGPFGAAIFRRHDHALIAVGVNSVARLQNSVLHAEMMALMFTEQAEHSFQLHGDPSHTFELFTSCSPCSMCLGAIFWSGISRVVWGAEREDVQAIGFDEGPVFAESFAYLRQRGVELTAGVLAEEARAVLQLYRERHGLIYNG